MSILCVELSEGRFSTLEDRKQKGLELGLSLYNEFGRESFVLVAVSKESFESASSTLFIMVFTSPITNKVEFQYSNLAPGFSLYKLGYEALVIKGRAPRLSYISMFSGTNEILPCEFLKGKDSASFDEIATKNLSDTTLSTARAADNGVKFASLLCRGKAVRGAGLGYVFSMMNLKGIVLQGFYTKDEGPKDKSCLRFSRKIETSKLARRTRKNGGNCIIDDALRLGWIPVKNNSRRFDPRAYFLDGESFAEIYGNYPDSCQECFLACGRRKKDNTSLPSWNECMALGTNIGLFDPRDVTSLVDSAHFEGLDVNHLGAILGYVSAMDSSNLEVLSLSGRTSKEYIKLIHSIGASNGVGAIFRDGLKAFPDSLQSAEGQAISYDLRGSFAEALMTSLCIDIFLPASLIIAKKELNERCSAIMALYELCYILALFSYGIGPLIATCLYWDKIPKCAFSSPSLLRFFARRFSICGLKGKDLLENGLTIFATLDPSFHKIPDFFEMNPESAKGTETVQLARLQEYFLEEKARAEIWVKSKSDIISKRSGKKSPAVGPDEDLGREGEPGLNK